jgi:hypothetical protein
VSLAYWQSLTNVTIKPSELDSIISQMQLLARFYRALAVADGEGTKLRIAERLLNLIQRIQPGSVTRSKGIPARKVANTAERARRARPTKTAAKSRKPHKSTKRQ